jgi:hypothetical protein
MRIMKRTMLVGEVARGETWFMKSDKDDTEDCKNAVTGEAGG